LCSLEISPENQKNLVVWWFPFIIDNAGARKYRLGNYLQIKLLFFQATEPLQKLNAYWVLIQPTVFYLNSLQNLLPHSAASHHV
jgi:hypothetical protein